MKYWKFLLTPVLALGLVLTGCEDDEDFVAPAMEASITSMEFDQTGGSQTLTLSSTRDWSSTIDADWITISPASGKASREYTITITVLPNTEYDREANIYFTFNAGTYESTLATVYISQPGELGEEDEGSGTYDDPYTVTGALSIINNGEYTSDWVYVHGYISQIDEISTSYGNATYYISDDGSTDEQLEVYHGYGLGNTKFTSEDDLQVGDEVIVYGELTMYYSTPEITQGSYIVSINDEGGSDDGDGSYTFTQASSITSGNQYLLVADGIMATPLASSYTYGYMYTESVTVSDGTITLSSLDDAFTFTAVDGGYTITDGDGRYYYQTGSYKSFNVSSTQPESGAVWSVSFNSDGTATIMNNDVSRYIQYDSSYSSWGSYADAQGTLPTLYEYGDGSGDGDDNGGDSGSSSNGWDNGDGTVTDQLTHDNVGVSGTSYTEWSGVTGYSSAVYAGQSAGGTSSTGDVVIQLRSNSSNSGIVTTGTADLSTKASEAVVKSVSVTWNANTSSGRVVNVYGSSTAYSAATELYDSSTQGTLIGTLEYDGSTTFNTLEVSDNYQYIGLRSSAGALYLDDVQIVWGEASEDSGNGDSGSSSVETVTIAEFIAAEESETQKYQLTGTVTSITNSTYGNFYLEDETGSVLVYGLVSTDLGYGYTNDKTFASLGVEAGDELTLIGYRGSYGSTIEVVSAYYVSHTPASNGGDDGGSTASGSGTESDPYNVAAALEIINAGTYTSDEVYITGTVSSITSISTSYGNASYYLSDDGTTTSDQLLVYRGYSLNGDKFTSEDEIAVGDVLVIKGVLTLYGTTPEVTTGSSIISINGSNGSSSSVTDAITASGITFSSTSGYQDWTIESSATNSGAAYAGQSNYNTSYIQLRSKNSNSGIVSTTSGGTLAKVAVIWNSSTASGRTLNVYGSTSAYSAPSELYDDTTYGTLIGTIAYDGTTTTVELEISGDYTHVGVRSDADAMYLDEIDITWAK